MRITPPTFIARRRLLPGGGEHERQIAAGQHQAKAQREVALHQRQVVHAAEPGVLAVRAQAPMIRSNASPTRDDQAGRGCPSPCADRWSRPAAHRTPAPQRSPRHCRSPPGVSSIRIRSVASLIAAVASPSGAGLKSSWGSAPRDRAVADRRILAVAHHSGCDVGRVDVRHHDALRAGIERARGVEMLEVRHPHDRRDPGVLGGDADLRGEVDLTSSCAPCR